MNHSAVLHPATHFRLPAGLTASGISRLQSGERANPRTKQDRILAVASHDLRQPVHALGLYIAELRRMISGKEQQYLIGQVERSVDSITTLINALLDISRLDAGVLQPQITPCDVSILLARIEADFQMAAGVRNIRLVVRPFHGYVISDALLLERIVTNLVSNALRYTRPYGTVLVACRRRGQHVLIEVRDNGVGIEKAHHAEIFREFFQLRQHQPDVQKGLGLGLAIVDRLVKLLGHSIALRSAPCKGSLFALRLEGVFASGASGDMPEPFSSDPAGLPLKGATVLIVDGDQPVLDGTARILTSWGCEISAVASLAAVQKLLDAGMSWDLVISDYQFEDDLTGLDIIKMVRQFSGRKTPCILISGDTSASILNMAKVAGHHLLHKPVKPAKLRSLVQFLCS